MSTAAPLQNTTVNPKQSSFLGRGGLLLQRQCVCGSPTSSLTGECEGCKSKKGLQTKLTIGASNDPLELEADRVADQVLAAPRHSAVHTTLPRIQRFTGQTSEGENAAPDSVDRVLASSGRPLEPALRQDMEQRFGHDFSQVRVHSDGAAAQSAQEVQANAYTVGQNIVFGAGRFAPRVHEGRRLIAHELTHVVQQSGSGGIHVSQGGDKNDMVPISVLEPAVQRTPLSETGDGLIQRDTKDASPSVEAGPPTSDEPDLAREDELYTLFLERTTPVRNPTIDEARLALMHDFVERGMFDLAAQLETAKVAAGPPTSSGADTEEFVHPDHGTIVRFRRNWSFLALIQPYVTVYWLPIPVKDKTSSATGPTAGGGGTAIADPLADLYRAKFPPKAGDKTSDHVDTLMKVQLALELCDATVMGELMEAFKGAIRDPAFYITTGLMVAIYVGLWLTPDPTLLTKIAVGIFTAIMLIMVTWEDLIGFAGAWLTLEAACKHATTEDELRAAGDAFLAKLGQVGFDVLLMLLFHGVEKGVGPKVRARVRARAVKRAAAAAAALRAEPGASLPGSPLKATPERAALLPNAKTAAGEGASPTATLDSLSDTLPTQEAKQGLSKLRAEKSDAEVLQYAEGQQRSKNDLVNWLTEQGMTKEQKALVKERASKAEADAAWQRIQQLRDDPALPEQTKRAGWVRNILILIEALGFESKRLRSVVKKRSIPDVAGIIAEIMARAEIGQRIKGIKGMEIQYDLELARKVEGYRSVNEWLQAQKEAWEANGKQGKEPDSRSAAKMRTRDGEVWESLGQADNMICERGADGKMSIKLLEEVKSGGETAESAMSQAQDFLSELTAMGEGKSGARLFERGAGAQLGSERTGDFNLSSAKTASFETRGLKGREGFTSNLDVDRPALEAAADTLIKKGLPPDLAGPPPPPLRDNRRDSEPVP